ncbi:MAG: hypothetical protein ABSA83_22510 [Verrucomicrobiota bacterium]
METLFMLQTLQLQSGPGQRNREASMEAMRKSIPPVALTHYDRLMAHGKKGVAIVRNGVCTECHLKVAIGALHGLVTDGDVQLCGNCGRYLYLPPQETAVPAVLPPVPKTVRHKKQSLAQAHAG